MRVELTFNLHDRHNIPVEAETIVPANFLDGTEIHVWRGNKEIPLEEIADIDVIGDAESTDDVEVVLRGETHRLKRVGEYMDGGRITVEGDIGMHCGNFMSGGEIEIKGNASGWLGREMRGGTIICHGNVADYCGANYRGEKRGMRGGMIEVLGDVGAFCAEALDGGTVIIHGNAGDMPGVEMRSGRLTIYGDSMRAGANMVGGSLTVLGTVYDMIPTFRRTGTVVHEETGRVLTAFTGDIANRGKGNLFAGDFRYLD
ncbi:MAG: formylmethanofuran dehydrogenase subunit C [Methanoculleaceae archaeon]